MFIATLSLSLYRILSGEGLDHLVRYMSQLAVHLSYISIALSMYAAAKGNS